VKEDPVSYIEGRIVHDADAHIMETPNWLQSYADPAIRDRIDVPGYANELKQTGDEPVDLDATFARLAERHRSEEFLTDEAAQVMLRKNFAATGSFLAADRPRALDYIGVRSQLMFNTFHNSRLFAWERSGDLELTAGVSRAHNRGMLDFCSVDERLFATAYVPFVDFDLAAEIATEAIAAGAGALLVGSDCPPEHSPSHRGLDRVWARAEEARTPVVFHVGGTGDLLSPSYFNNGLPIPPDFHGGDENFRSVDYMGIAHPPMQTIAAMVFDGVFERFPDLRLGVIEQGAVWLHSFCKRMESAFDAFHRHESRRCHFDPPNTCSARSGPRRTRRKTSAGSPTISAPTCACSPATTPTWRVAATPTGASNEASATAATPFGSRSTATT